MKKNTFYLILLILITTHAVFAQGTAKYFVYVSATNDDKIVIYQMDAQTGQLTKSAEKSVSDNPWALALAPSKKYLYVVNHAANNISSFQVNQQNGDLSYLNTIPVLHKPCYISVDVSGRYLFAVYWSKHKATVHKIDPDGKLLSPAIQTFDTDKNPHQVITFGANKYALITSMGDDKLLQYSFDENNGQVTANANGQFVDTKPGAGPRHFVFHNNKNIAYVLNELNGTVTAYNVDVAKGTLDPFQTISSLAPTYSGKNNSADIHITPDNQFLYATNRGPDTISGYKIDSTTGELELIDHFETVKWPREFEIDPTGNFLFAAGQNDNKLASYRINQTTGALEAIDVHTVGAKPSWVLAVALGDK